MHWKRFFILLGLLAGANVAGLLLLPLVRYHQIVIHHSASAAGNLESIRDGHRHRLGLSEAAYHLVLSNGLTDVPLGHLEATLRYRRLGPAMATRSIAANVVGVHVCVIGNYDEGPVPLDVALALGHAVKILQRRFAVPDGGIRLHRDASSTACPGRYVTRERILEWVAMADACPPAIMSQQRGVVARCGFTPGTMPRKALLVLVAGNGMGLSLIAGMSYRRRRRLSVKDHIFEHEVQKL